MMDLTDVDTIKTLCAKYGIIPNTDAGQHFLVNREALKNSVAAAQLTPADTVLEVGPGLGTLTAELAQHAGRVIAVELDPKLHAAARAILAPYKNVELICGNILSFQPSTYNLKTSTYKLVSNLPYGITGRLFRLLLTQWPRPTIAVVMVQQEVAERITAPPGDLSVLGVMCQLYAEPTIELVAPRQDFWPVPEVDSAVVVLKVRGAVELAELIGDAGVTPEAVLRVARFGFAARRKTLQNNFLAAPFCTMAKAEKIKRISQALRDAGVLEKSRAQEVSVPQWITLAKKLKNCLN